MFSYFTRRCIRLDSTFLDDVCMRSTEALIRDVLRDDLERDCLQEMLNANSEALRYWHKE